MLKIIAITVFTSVVLKINISCWMTHKKKSLYNSKQKWIFLLCTPTIYKLMKGFFYLPTKRWCWALLHMLRCWYSILKDQRFVFFFSDEKDMTPLQQEIVVMEMSRSYVSNNDLQQRGLNEDKRSCDATVLKMIQGILNWIQVSACQMMPNFWTTGDALNTYQINRVQKVTNP